MVIQRNRDNGRRANTLLKAAVPAIHWCRDYTRLLESHCGTTPSLMATELTKTGRAISIAMGAEKWAKHTVWHKKVLFKGKPKPPVSKFCAQWVRENLPTDYQVHPNQIGQWKKQLVEGLPSLFASGRAKAAQKDEALQARLYEEIGRLKGL